MKLSVIIPIFNTEQYLAKCLESVIKQSIQDLQIICINDGSTDNSLEILKEFSRKDSRILIIDQKNQGVSAARNAGLKIAKGKYIGFVDSDDTIAPAFFENLYIIAEREHCNIVFSKSLSQKSFLKNDKKYNKKEIIAEILPLYFMEDGYNAIWNKLYSVSIITNNNIVFQLDKSHGEDADFNIHYLLHAEHLFNVNYSGYHYRETEGSATRNAAKFNYLQNAVYTFEKDWFEVIGDNISSSKMHELKKERFINNIISQIYIYAIPTNGLPIKSRLRKLTEIVSNETVILLFSEDNSTLTNDFHRYQLQIYKAIQAKSLIKLYLLSLYSYYRNQ